MAQKTCVRELNKTFFFLNPIVPSINLHDSMMFKYIKYMNLLCCECVSVFFSADKQT